ncbi:hypothetical protein CEXT_23131 [Caerostris extrusa]|uniref:Uncharacterized protein n=1 Tax=Caerostris extrusa TaxID=172846 RepID=A0AAV4WF95_CAEEX|nr:hypothetical protein CEXT_23131 [Caerostris extrusa]
MAQLNSLRNELYARGIYKRKVGNFSSNTQWFSELYPDVVGFLPSHRSYEVRSAQNNRDTSSTFDHSCCQNGFARFLIHI